MPAIAREREIRAAELRRDEELERVDAMRRLQPVALIFNRTQQNA